MEPVSGLHVFAMTSVNFAYGFMLSNQGLLLAPLEAERLFPTRASVGLAGLAVCSGLAQLCGPAAGRWSDLYRAREGKRLPCLLKAAGAACIFTGLLPMLSAFDFGLAFISLFFLQQIAWNVLQTVQVALVPDLLSEQQRGFAGGMTAAHTLVGALCGLLAVRFIGADHPAKHYLIAVALTVLCVVLVLLSAQSKEVDQCRELYLPARPEMEMEAAPQSLFSQLPECYKFDRERYPEFAKLLVSKSMYSANVMVKGFLLYFVQDTFQLQNLDREQAIVGNTAIAAEATAAFAAIVSIGILSRASSPSSSDTSNSAEDEGTSRAKLPAICGAVWMAFLWFGPPSIGYGVLQETQKSVTPDVNLIAEHWVKWMIVGTGTWGFGQGLYLAGDQALGYALLPDRNEASRYLGLTSVYSAFGAVIGGSVTGGLLHVVGSFGKLPPDSPDATGPGYAYPGYAAMFFFASCLSMGSCVFLSMIRLRSSQDTLSASSVSDSLSGTSACNSLRM